MNTDEPISFSIRDILLILVLGCINLFSNFHRVTMGVLGDYLVADFSLTAVQLGAMGSAIFYAYGLMQLPCGILADRISAKKLLALSSLLTAVSVFWFALAGGYTGLIGSRVMTGLCTALAFVPALTVTRRHFGDSHYAILTAITCFLCQFGCVLATAPLKVLSDAIGWQNALISTGVLSVLLAVAAWFLVPDHVGQDGGKAAEGTPGTVKDKAPGTAKASVSDAAKASEVPARASAPASGASEVPARASAPARITLDRMEARQRRVRRGL